MILRTALLAVVLAACSGASPAGPTSSTTPSLASSATPETSVSTSPENTTSAAATATPAASPTATTGVRAPALETFAVGALRGVVAFVIRPGPAELREVWAVPLDGRAPTRAARFRTPNDNGAIDTNMLERQFSPDGKRVVLSVAMGDVDVVSQLVVVDLESGRVTPLLQGSAPAFDHSYPAWSPDGSLIAFVRWPHGAGISPREIWVVGADGL